jgi:hypothetical protein
MKRSFSHIRTHSFAGKRFRILWRRVDPLHDGKCDNPSTKNKKIFIGPNLDEFDLLELVIHESEHASYHNLDEPTIERGAHDTASLLWRMGWRLK